jgi:tRNA dimethylallyltransferase
VSPEAWPPLETVVEALTEQTECAIRARIDAEGPQAMHAELVRRDPAGAARIREGDSMRIGRALEVLEATGRTLSDCHRDGMPAALDPEQAVKVFLSVDRGELYRRIDVRFDAMLEAGALEEVRALAARNLDPLLPAMKAHGVPWLIRHLKGEMTLAEAADEGKRDTRRYTKRQETWFRNQMPGWRAITPGADLDAVLEQLRLSAAR